MDVNLIFVSSICWESMFSRSVRVKNAENAETVPKVLRELIYDTWPAFREENYKIYWQYARGEFVQVRDYFSFFAFVTLKSSPDLYVVLSDSEKFYPDTKKFLQARDLMELRDEKEAKRRKYDLKSEAEEINAEIKRCLERLEEPESQPDSASEKEILTFALRKMSVGKCYTTDICSGYSLIDCVKKAMRGPIIECSPHATDIYFLETDEATRNEENNLENLFMSPAGREMLKYKPAPKLKQKMNSNLEFFVNRPRQSSRHPCHSPKPTSPVIDSRCASSKSESSSSSCSDSRRSSIDLYEEAASILGLTCAETDDCKCIECQCHYFDFEEEIDFPTTGNDYSSLPNDSTCSIQ